MKAPIGFINSKGVKYQIYFRKITEKDLEGMKASAADGICYAPDSKHPKIIIDPTLTETKTLQTLIHEMLHAHLWDKNEKEIRKIARTIAEMIQLLGWENKNYAKTKKRKSKKNTPDSN